MIHVIVKADMRNITRIPERNWRGTSARAGIGRNGGAFTDIVLKALRNRRAVYRRDWLFIICPNLGREYHPTEKTFCRIKVRLHEGGG